MTDEKQFHKVGKPTADDLPTTEQVAAAEASIEKGAVKTENRLGNNGASWGERTIRPGATDVKDTGRTT